MWASQRGHSRIVRELLKHKLVDVNVAGGDDGDTALLLASLYDRSEVVRELLKSDMIDVNVTDAFGETALTGASQEGHAEVVRELLKHEMIDVNITSEDGDLAFNCARENHHLDVILEFLKCGKVPDMSLESRFSALSLAQLVSDFFEFSDDYDERVTCELANLLLIRASKRGGKKKAVRRLLRYSKVDVDIANEYGLLVLAIRNDHWNVVEELLDQEDVDVNVQCRLGYTALMWAILKGRFDTVTLLLEHHHVDTNMSNIAGSTALDVARNCGMLDSANLLEEHALQSRKRRKLESGRTNC